MDTDAHIGLSGHVSASRAAYMLKSPEMKDHVGRICDEMTKRRKEVTNEPAPRARNPGSRTTSQVAISGLSETAGTGTAEEGSTHAAAPKKSKTKKKVANRPDSAISHLERELPTASTSRAPVSRKKSPAARSTGSSAQLTRKKSVLKVNK